jgi:glycosyltransferase involved in cell wall biosynthesis
MAASPLRLAVVLSHPTQYYSPWFRSLGSEPRLDLRVFYLWDFGVAERHDPRFGRTVRWDLDLLEGYEHEFLPNTAARPGAEHFFGFRNPGLRRRLAAWRPDAVLLFGYKWASHLQVVAWAAAAGIPLLFRGDSHLIGRPAPAGVKRLALRLLFSRFAAALCVGAANREYFRAFGMPAERLFFAPHSVNAAHFDPLRPETQEGAQALRRHLGLPPAARVLLFAGKFVPAKQPAELIAAFLRVGAPDLILVMVGDGAERPRLEALAAAAPAGPHGPPVRFLPFANQSEMPARYLLADAFVLPSRGGYETWGLAVNEAMHLGVPCLVSTHVGCQRDLVSPGETGWVFDPAQPDGLAAALRAVAADLGQPERRAALRAAVLQRIGGYTYAATTAGLLNALEHAVRRP